MRPPGHIAALVAGRRYIPPRIAFKPNHHYLVRFLLAWPVIVSMELSIP